MTLAIAKLLPLYPPAGHSASQLLPLASLPSPGTRLPPSARGCVLTHSLTKFFFSAPSGHPAPGPGFYLESCLRDAYRLDGRREIYRVEKPEKGEVMSSDSKR